MSSSGTMAGRIVRTRGCGTSRAAYPGTGRGSASTVLYGEYARVDDGLAGSIIKGHGYYDLITGSEATVWGLGVVQHIDAAAMELFLAYRRYSAEVTSPG